jgi:pilus assembly protein CpaF
MKAEFVERVRSRVASAGNEVTFAAVADAIRDEAGGVVGDKDVLAAIRLLHQEFEGAGPLEPLLMEPGTTDVLVTGPDEVWVDGPQGLRKSGIRFGDEASVRRLARDWPGRRGEGLMTRNHMWMRGCREPAG